MSTRSPNSIARIVAAADLPADQRLVVHGRIWEGRSNQEIAMTLNCTRQWVSQLFGRAADTLRHTLADQAEQLGLVDPRRTEGETR